MYEAQITTNYLSKQFDVNYNSGLNIRPFTVSFNIQLSNCGTQFETLSHSDWMSVTRVGSSCQRPWEVGKRRALNLQKHGMEPRKIVHTTDHFVATKLRWRPSYCDIYRTGNLLLKQFFFMHYYSLKIKMDEICQIWKTLKENHMIMMSWFGGLFLVRFLTCFAWPHHFCPANLLVNLLMSAF